MAEAEMHEQVCAPRFSRLEGRVDAVFEDVNDLKVNFSVIPEAITAIKTDVAEIKVMEAKRKASKADWLKNIIIALLGSGAIVNMVIWLLGK